MQLNDKQNYTLNIHLYRLFEEVNLKSYKLSFEDHQQCSCPHHCHNSLVSHICIHLEHNPCMLEGLNFQQKFLNFHLYSLLEEVNLKQNLFLELFPLSPRLWNLLHLAVDIQDHNTWVSLQQQ